MARSDYLVKVNGVKLGNKFFKFDSYQATFETLDLDSYRDTNGELHRNALDHRCMKVEWETPYMYENDMNSLMALIRSNYLSAKEQSIIVECYNPEMNNYITQKMYLANVTFKVAQNSPFGIIYQPTRFALIAY